MGIIVASSNLFRLELSVYLLAEAGFIVHETRSVDALLGAMECGLPSLIVLDSQLGGELPVLLSLLAERGSVPVLVVGSVAPASLQTLHDRGGDAIGWPYQNDELVARAQALRQAARAVQPCSGAALCAGVPR